MLRKWEELPEFMKNDEVKKYYEILSRKKFSLLLKRISDLMIALILVVILAIPMAVISIRIVLESKGGVFYRQERITSYGKKVRIHKFRTMVPNADQTGALITVSNDNRITATGKWMRDKRIDEIPQLFDVIEGNMSFVGTRPEVTKYVEQYTDEMMATLLLPAGITSEASNRYKDEAKLLDEAKDVEAIYISRILPDKMQYNLESIREFSFFREIKTMFRTISVLMGKECR